MKPTQDELNKMDWRDRYEYEAKREYESLSRLTEGELLERITHRRLDGYFAIWRAIGEAGTVENSASVLWDFLQGSPGKENMLQRYHCAGALFRILDMEDPASKSELRRAVQWDHQGEDARQQALLELKEIIDRAKSE